MGTMQPVHMTDSKQPSKQSNITKLLATNMIEQLHILQLLKVICSFECQPPSELSLGWIAAHDTTSLPEHLTSSNIV